MEATVTSGAMRHFSRRSRGWKVLCLLLLALPLPSQGLEFAASRSSYPTEGQTSGLADAIRNRIEAGRTRGQWAAAGDVILAVRALPRFYVERGWEEVWLSAGELTPGATEFLNFLRRADEEGLRPEDYHLQVIDSLRWNREDNTESDLRRQVDLEILLSDAFLVLGSHLLQGRVNPVSIDPEWLANRRNVSMGQVLEEAAATGDFAEALENLLPPQAGYSGLKTALSTLRHSETEPSSAGISGGEPQTFSWMRRGMVQ